MRCKDRNIFLKASTCGSLGFACHLPQLQTENIIWGQLVVKYNNGPIMLQYVFKSTVGLSNEGLKRVPHAITIFTSEPSHLNNLSFKIAQAIPLIIFLIYKISFFALANVQSQKVISFAHLTHLELTFHQFFKFLWQWWVGRIKTISSK